MTPDQLDSQKLWCSIIVCLILILVMVLLGSGCSDQYNREEILIRPRAQLAIEPQNKAPPNPNRVAEIREVLDLLCFACKHGEYIRGYNDGLNYQKEKGKER